MHKPMEESHVPLQWSMERGRYEDVEDEGNGGNDGGTMREKDVGRDAKTVNGYNLYSVTFRQR